MILFLACIIMACTLIGTLRGYRKHAVQKVSHENAIVEGFVDGLLIGILVAGTAFCAWQVLKFWTGLIVLGWIFWPKHHRSSS